MVNDKSQRKPFDLINPVELYDSSAHGYSHVALIAANSRIAMIAGQGGETLDGGLSTDFTEQVRQALVNLASAAKAAGGSMQHIVKHTMLVVDFDDSKLQILAQELERAYSGHKPTGTLIPVPRLALSSMLFEIDAVLAVPSE